MITTVLKFIMCQVIFIVIRADHPNMTARITADLRAAVQRDNPALVNPQLLGFRHFAF